MDENDTSYMDFLKIYFPETADSIAVLKTTAPKGDTPEELKKNAAEVEEKIKAAVNKAECVSKYNVYEQIPQAIRDRYPGAKIPQDIMEAAERGEYLTLQEMAIHPEIKRVEDAREAVREKYDIPSEIVSTAGSAVFLAAMVAGYSQHASTQLALQRQHREGLLDKKEAILQNNNLSEEQKDKLLKEWFKDWIESRKETADTIRKDWQQTQPEKYLIHLLGKFNRGKISKEELMPQLADLMQAIDTEGRQDKLLEYLKKDNIQAKIGHFKNETRDILANLVLQKIPESEREQYLYQGPKKNRELKQSMLADNRAKVVATNIAASRAGALPPEHTLTETERMANMPTMFNQGRERQN